MVCATSHFARRLFGPKRETWLTCRTWRCSSACGVPRGSWPNCSPTKLAERTQWPSLRDGTEATRGRRRRVRLVDATCVCRPGASDTDGRIHLGFDLAALCIDRAELTDASGGETLVRLEVASGDLLVADGGYSHR